MSWVSFVSEAVAKWKSKSRRERVVAAAVVLLHCLVLIVFLISVFVSSNLASRISRKNCSACSGGQRDYFMGAIQLAKLLLEMLSVVIYALGPQKSRFRRRLRFHALGAILFSSFVVLRLTFSDLLPPTEI